MHTEKTLAVLISNYPLPPGVAIEMIDAQDQLKDFKPLIGAAFLLIFIILASTFESLSAPFVLVFFSAVGGNRCFDGIGDNRS